MLVAWFVAHGSMIKSALAEAHRADRRVVKT